MLLWLSGNKGRELRVVGRFDKGGETVQRCVTEGERSEPSVFQVVKSGLRRSPIASSDVIRLLRSR